MCCGSKNRADAAGHGLPARLFLPVAQGSTGGSGLDLDEIRPIALYHIGFYAIKFIVY
jgi:hypothetical protein